MVYSMKVLVKLELVVVILRFAFGIQVILATEICEGAGGSEWDVRIIDA